jgi:hypothetical protein
LKTYKISILPLIYFSLTCRGRELKKGLAQRKGEGRDGERKERVRAKDWGVGRT